MTYSWDTKHCVRYGEDFTGENHPCYWCGKPPKDMLGPDTKWCERCHGFFCPHCGKCWCNVSKLELSALKKLRNKYCCNWYYFKKGINSSSLDVPLLSRVPGFILALEYCRRKKGC